MLTLISSASEQLVCNNTTNNNTGWWNMLITVNSLYIYIHSLSTLLRTPVHSNHFLPQHMELQCIIRSPFSSLIDAREMLSNFLSLQGVMKHPAKHRCDSLIGLNRFNTPFPHCKSLCEWLPVSRFRNCVTLDLDKTGWEPGKLSKKNRQTIKNNRQEQLRNKTLSDYVTICKQNLKSINSVWCD